MRSCFYCLGKKALKALEAVSPSQLSAVAMIVIGQDKNVVNDYSEDIRLWAENNNISWCLRDGVAAAGIVCDYHIAVGWRWLLPAGTEQKLIVFHDSLLPQYRGYNPLVTALINGDTEIGATCFWADEGADTGPVLLSEKKAISYPIKISAAIDIVAELYGNMLNRLLDILETGESHAGIPQDETKATYSLWRDETDYLIDWNNSAAFIQRFINAAGYPYKGAFFYHNNEKIRVSDATVLPDVVISNRTPGKVFSIANGCATVVCGSGLLRIDKMTDGQGNIFRIQHLRTRLN